MFGRFIKGERAILVRKFSSPLWFRKASSFPSPEKREHLVDANLLFGAIAAVAMAMSIAVYKWHQLGREFEETTRALGKYKKQVDELDKRTAMEAQRKLIQKLEQSKLENEGEIIAKEILDAKQNEWNLSSNAKTMVLKTIFEDHAFGEFRVNEVERNQLLMFLYVAAANVFQPKVRLEAFQSLLRASPERMKVYRIQPGADPAVKKLNRLKELVLFGDKELPVAPNSFDEFATLHPEWADPSTSFVFFRDDERVKHKPGTFVERLQSSGLCSMHASIVLHHYLLAMNNEEASPMLDLGSYLRRSLRGYELHDHVWRNTGTHSLLFLRRLLEDNSEILTLQSTSKQYWSSKNTLASELKKNLLAYGPGLLSRFHAEKHFSDDGKWQHLGTPQSELVGLHSMVLVGYREDRETGEDRFLLQNWWSGKQFVEIDTAYLRNCLGEVHFVVTKQHKFPDDLPTKGTAIVERWGMFPEWDSGGGIILEE